VEKQETTEVQDKATIRLFALIGTVIMIIAWADSWGEFISAFGGLGILLAILAVFAKSSGGL